MVAGAAHEVVQPGAFAAEDEDAVAGKVELVVVACAAFIETDDPEILLFQIFKRADKVDDAGHAKVLCRAGAGLDCDGTEGCGSALSEHDAVDARAVCHAKQRAEVLRIFYAVEGEHKAFGSRLDGREKVLNGEELLRPYESDNALVGGGSGYLGELLAGFLADADSGFAADSDETPEALILALAGDENMIEAAAAGAECLLDRMNTVENFHAGSLDCR